VTDGESGNARRSKLSATSAPHLEVLRYDGHGRTHLINPPASRSLLAGTCASRYQQYAHYRWLPVTVAVGSRAFVRSFLDFTDRRR